MMARLWRDNWDAWAWVAVVLGIIAAVVYFNTGCVTVDKIVDADGAQRIGEAVTKGVTDFVERLIPEPVEGTSTELAGIIGLGAMYAMNQGRKWWVRRNG